MDEEQELEALKKWWKESGKMVIAGVVLGLGGVFAWNSWQAYVDAQAEKASILYEILVDIAAEERHADALRQADLLITEYPKAGYAGLAALIAARSAYLQEDVASAKKHLTWATQHGTHLEVQTIARLRLAKLAIEEKDFEGALSVLDEIKAPGFAASAQEVKGDALRSKGDTEAASKAYAAVLAMPELRSGIQARVQAKLDDLDVEAPSSATQ